MNNDESYKLNYNDPVYKKYVSDFDSWKKDGKRFMTESFINHIKEEETIPKINDGQPEFNIWISLINATGVFCNGGWNSGTRYNLAQPFIENMLNIYTEKEVPNQYLLWLRYSLYALEDTKDI